MTFLISHLFPIKQYKNHPTKIVAAEDITIMAEFVLNNNLFEFRSKSC